jgi:hypothetical protein
VRLSASIGVAVSTPVRHRRACWSQLGTRWPTRPAPVAAKCGCLLARSRGAARPQRLPLNTALARASSCCTTSPCRFGADASSPESKHSCGGNIPWPAPS